jgi:NAD+ synthase (glutamine-hydrolysing)
LALAYVNLVGGQDDLVFDGKSFYQNRQGEITSLAKSFEEDLLVVGDPKQTPLVQDELSEVFSAICLGIRDYVRKTGNKGVVVGLSGGIDSALVAALAVQALGKENVVGVRMPSRFSSEHSLKDAELLSQNLGIDLRTLEIDKAHQAFEATVPLNAIAGENIQARIRAVLLMAISNNEGLLVLNTGNKSEVAVGYSTIYGDSIGAYAPLKDLYKSDVWRLSSWINKHLGGEVIPENSISKAPSAELRPGQVDTDSLPDYHELDSILRHLIENHATVAEVVSAGFAKETVLRVDRMVRAAEWKRSQAPIGPRLSKVSFGRGRRVPLATKFGDLS